MTPTPTSLAAVVFDWAGTIVDFGSCAPMGAFVRLFARYDIELRIEEARGPMGMAKWDHIHALGQLPGIAADDVPLCCRPGRVAAGACGRGG